MSWFGTVVFDEKLKSFTIGKVVLLEQINNSIETEIDGLAISKAMYDLRDEPGDLRWWGHSHVDMPCYWSPQDMHTMRDLGREGWILATVFNQKNQFRSAYLQSVDVMGEQQDFFVDDIKTEFPRYLDKSLTDQWDAAYDEKVLNYETQVTTGNVAETVDMFDYPHDRMLDVGDYTTPIHLRGWSIAMRGKTRDVLREPFWHRGKLIPEHWESDYTNFDTGDYEPPNDPDEVHWLYGGQSASSVVWDDDDERGQNGQEISY